MLETTLTANKRGLGPAVVTGYVSTSTASLAGLAGVNHNDLTSGRFSLVLNKALKLSKAPRMESAAGFPVIDLESVSDIRKVLQHDSGTRFNIPDNRGGDNVVTIPSEALFTPSEASKMSFGRLRTIGLKITFKAKDTFDYFLLMAGTMKAVIRRNGWMSNSQINADSLAVGNKFNIGQLNDNMKVEFALAVDKVSGGSFTVGSIGSVSRQTKSDLHSTAGGRHTDESLIPVNLEGFEIVFWGTKLRLWGGNLSTLFLKRQSRFNRLGSLLPSLYMQIRNQLRQEVFAVMVGKFMQGVGITGSLFVSYFANDIECLSKLFYCLMQGLRLIVRWFKLNLYRSIHNYIIPYNQKKLQGGWAHSSS
jgi:hypothetical protein